MTTDLTPVQSSEPQKSIAMVPKRACELMDAEVVRLLKLTGSAVVPVSFCVPRKVRKIVVEFITLQSKSEFQEDLYPPTRSTEPALVHILYCSSQLPADCLGVAWRCKQRSGADEIEARV